MKAPDIRIIVLMGYPVMAMLRLPILSIRRQGQPGYQGRHWRRRPRQARDCASNNTLPNPDTTNAVDGVQLPYWDGFMKLAGCCELCGLLRRCGHGADQEKGPLILSECAAGAEYPDRYDSGLTLRAHAVEVD